MRRPLVLLCFAFLLFSCRDSQSSVEDYNLRPVTLPDGTVIKVEVVTNQVDMNRGMMFRDTLPEGRGMLFIHGSPNKYPYWMFQTKIPLDIIWMDRVGKVVEISENTPPCKSKSAVECPNYGGTVDALVVLEVPGGYGRKHGVRMGNLIRF